MRRRSFSSIFGIFAIAMVSIGYVTFLLHSTPDPTFIVGFLVAVSLILGMGQIVLGNEIRGIENMNYIRSVAASPDKPLLLPAVESHAYSAPRVITAETRIPPNFPLSPSQPSVSREDADAERIDRPVGWTADINDEAAASKKLEPVLKALHRGGPLPREPQVTPNRIRRTKKSRSNALAVSNQGADVNNKRFRVALVGRSEVVLLATNTGQEHKYPSEDADVLQAAWRAFAKGVEVKPTFRSGRITQLEIEEAAASPSQPR